MKVAFTLLVCALITCAVAAEENSATAPKARPRLDPSSSGATAAPQAPAAQPSASTPVTLSRYIVRDSALRNGASQWLPTPQGAPALSGRRFLDAVQTGNLLEHTGPKFTTGIVTHGESVNGFGRVTLGFHFSW